MLPIKTNDTLQSYEQPKIAELYTREFEDRVITFFSSFFPRFAQATAMLYDNYAKCSSKFDPVPIDSTELNYWNTAFQLTERIVVAARSKLLYLPVQTDSIDLLTHRNTESVTGKDLTKPGFSYAGSGSGTERIIYVPWGPDSDPGKKGDVVSYDVDQDGLEILIKPKFEISARCAEGDHISWLEVRPVLADSHGRPILHRWMQYPTSYGGSCEVYHPFKPITAASWLNPRITLGGPNSLKIVANDEDGKLLLKTELNNPDTISELVIPTDMRTRLYLWQIERFLRFSEIDSNKQLVEHHEQ